MGRLLVLFFVMPWWAYIPASMGVFWLGERVYQSALQDEAEKAAALETSMPEAVDIAAFDKTRDIHAADEVHVTGWIDTDLNYELVERTNGVPTTTRYMYVLFGANDPDGSQDVRAAMILTKAERDLFLERLDDFVVGFTQDGEFVFDFNGFADSTATLGGMATDALADHGLTRAADFIYIEPFFAGREAALAPHGASDRSRHIGWLIAAAVALLGVVKRVRSVRKRGAHPETEAAGNPELADPLTVAAPALGLPSTVDPNSPLGRIARRRAEALAPQAPDADPMGAPTATLAARNDMSADVSAAAERDHVELAKADPTRQPHGHTAPRRLRAGPESAPVFDSAGPTPDPRFGDPVDVAPAMADKLLETVGRKARGMPGLADEAAAPPKRKSATGYYAKLVLGMALVGGIAYKPAIVGLALPFIGVALFWFGVYVVYQRLRAGARKLADRVTREQVRKHERRVQTVSFGAGGSHFDLTSPIRPAGRRERRAS